VVKNLKWLSLILIFIIASSVLSFFKEITRVDAQNDILIDYEKEKLESLFTFTEMEDGYYISGYKGNETYLQIPDYYNGKKVTGIINGTDDITVRGSKGVFYNQRFIKIDFGNNLNYIGRGSFNKCESLTEIIVPDNVTQIDNYAFYNCTNLSKIDLPKTLNYVGFDAFANTAWYNKTLKQDDKQNEVYYQEYNSETNSYDNTMLFKVLELNTENSTSYVVKEGTRLIASQVFLSNIPLKEMFIPNTVECIGNTLLAPPPYKVQNLSSIRLDYLNCQLRITENGNIVSKEKREEFFRNVILGEYTFAKVGEEHQSATYLEGNLTSFSSGAQAGTLTITVQENTTRIIKKAFYSQKSIKEIIIPESVNYIGVEAFKGCQNLQKVTFAGSGEVIIDSSAFEGCTSLTTIVGGENIVDIGCKAFSGCTKLNGISLGNVVIRNKAFFGCNELANVIQKSEMQIKRICQDAFSGTALYSSQAENVTIGNFLIKYNGNATELVVENNLADYVFEGTKLQEVTINENVYLGEGAFSECIKLQEVTFNNNDVSDFCFENCTKLDTINGKVNSIGDFAFVKTKITSFKSESLKEIGSFAFYDSSLQNIDICTATLNDYALFGTKELSQISATGSLLYTVKDNVLYSQDNQLLILYPASLAASTITLNGHTIYKGAFSFCKNVPVIEGNVSEIADRAFYGASVIFNATETKKLGYKAFYNSKIEQLSLIDLEEIADKSLNYCTSLTSLDISSNKITLPLGVLKGCSNLTDLTCGLNRQGNQDYKMHLGYVFGLDFYEGAEVVEQKYESAFKKVYYMPKLQNVAITSGKVGFGALMNLKHLISAEISDAVSEISAYSFYGCENLENVILSKNVTVLPMYVFSNCSSLKGINGANQANIEKVEFIGQYAFNRCNQLNSIVIGENLKASAIWSGAFSNCSNLINVSIASYKFFDVDNGNNTYGGLFDKAQNVVVQGEALTLEQIEDLKSLKIVGQGSKFKRFLKENKVLLLCLLVVLFAVCFIFVYPLIKKRIKFETVDEYGRPVVRHRHHHRKKHHHRRHHHHEHRRKEE